ncbi:MAG TPA: zinc-binding dehydrogenase [Steroidobacteraceae bacterium]|jgi:NADPH:quinone reductase-like Zn-dependent oxidoreductase|nr:zinc-binding dehydrogenase [Steroidobacteraceae bacterium]
MASNTETGLQIRSLVKKSGVLEVSLVSVPTPEPAADEIVIRVEATPINPSDIALLLGPVDMNTAKQSGATASPVLTANILERAIPALSARFDQSMPVGNEGAGTVVKAGSSPAAQALMGKLVAVASGSMYSQFKVAKAVEALVLPSGTTAQQAASCFVNPLTALSMVEVMRREGHKALVHTAAASNLGQMLNKICQRDGVSLVNVVRSAEQANILKELGAKIVLDSTSPRFMSELIEAVGATEATLAFDAIGGGMMASQILTAMEAAAAARMTSYNRYGSNTFKQVYIYGMLDTSRTELTRTFGFSWSVSGWLLTPFLQKIGMADVNRLRQRVVSELTTTFASHYTKEISLRDVAKLEIAQAYNKRATGEKFLIVPTL